jgi:ubiquinone/menaquinone biosynthesis C-methylase UbiE
MSNEFDYKEHYRKDAEEFDYFEERTGATAHDEQRVHEFIFSEIKDYNTTLLDVGCGSAWIAASLLPKGVTVVSLDISKVNPLKAVNLYPSPAHSGVTADTYMLPFKSASYNYVVASEIIEHLTNPEGFIKELFRVIKPGGKLIITTPYKEKLRYVLCIHCNQKTPLHSHIQSFDEIRLAKLYNGTDLKRFNYKIFGNKVLIFLRTYPLLKAFPFPIWRFIDTGANKVYNIPAHIMGVYEKSE